MARWKSKTKKPDFTNKDYKKLNIINLNNANELMNKNIIGADETGVGDYLTPLVAAAVYVDKDNIEQLIELGVKDSKQLSDAKIKDIFPKIKDLIKYRVNHLTQKGYNNLNKYMNAHELKMLLHLKSITQLEKIDKVNEDGILLDAFASDENITKYYDTLMSSSRLKTDEINKEIYLAQKAENIHVAVATASIVARYHFLQMMEEQEAELGMKFPLGTNEEVEKVALEFCQQYGRKALYEIAKISFKTTEKIDSKLKEDEK